MAKGEFVCVCLFEFGEYGFMCLFVWWSMVCVCVCLVKGVFV